MLECQINYSSLGLSLIDLEISDVARLLLYELEISIEIIFI